MPSICIVPAVNGIGGMASFRQKFEMGIKARGVQVTHDPQEFCDAILIIAGSRHLLPLWKARRRGVRVVQRLDGINWIQRRRNTGPRHFLRAEYGNLILSLIRSRIATHIIYQSEFTHHWWNDWYGPVPPPISVVLNGVDLSEYQPQGVGEPPSDRYRLLVVEGSLGGGYDMGLSNAVQLAETLVTKKGFSVELMVVGKIREYQKATVQSRSKVPILWMGQLPHGKIPEVDRSAHIFFSADLNPACPNAVIEALACGLPVAAFDTGALNEIVLGSSGKLVPYGGDPWKLELPDIPALAEASAVLLRDQPRFRRAARTQAEKALGIDKMVDGYLNILLEA